jgi:hypothetical protein
VANLSMRVSDDLLARFDAAAGSQGGRAPTLRRLMDQAAAGSPSQVGRLPSRPLKLTVRLTDDDGDGLSREAAALGLTPNGWAAALIRHRLHGKLTFPRAEAVALLAIQGEVRRIGVNVNQIARALNTAVMEGKVLDLEVAYLDALRTELRAHMFTLREAFEGNLAYWAVEP